MLLLLFSNTERVILTTLEMTGQPPRSGHGPRGAVHHTLENMGTAVTNTTEIEPHAVPIGSLFFLFLFLKKSKACYKSAK